MGPRDELTESMWRGGPVTEAGGGSAYFPCPAANTCRRPGRAPDSPGPRRPGAPLVSVYTRLPCWLLWLLRAARSKQHGAPVPSEAVSFGVRGGARARQGFRS